MALITNSLTAGLKIRFDMIIVFLLVRRDKPAGCIEWKFQTLKV